MKENLWQMSANELIDGYRKRSFSPVDVTKEVFERIEKIDPLLSAFLALNYEDAMASAKNAEQAWATSKDVGLLCGVPISLKDSIELAGHPTTYGSKAFENNVQPDSEIAMRIRNQGGVIIGKTNLPEFALHGAVDNKLSPAGRNPWNLEHTCGGSSGGAGSQVAAGLGPLAIGTDSGGSVRMPASINGIFAIKPTYQRIPSVQTWRAAPGRSHNGPMTRTVDDSALIFQALAGYDPRDPESNLEKISDYFEYRNGDISGLTIAVSYDFGRGFPMDSEALEKVRETAQLFEKLGCQIIEADPPTIEESEELEPGIWAYSGDHYAAAEAMIPNFLEKHLNDLSDVARPVYEAGPYAKAWQYRRIVRRNRAYGLKVQEWFKDYDFLLSPEMGPAQKLDSMKLPDRTKPPQSFNTPFNHAYNPAASVPAGFHSNGLPLGVQIVGRLGDDVGVLRMAYAMEKERPWSEFWPEISKG
ncbi:MAG: amidase [SAR202 cluster bacterium]|nr:amidase [SAR202 cluster bacterium]|tara:strand:- start:20993 stop:22408 length:1416 start_codon:yes stop_codon:yes gene_type:complete